MRRFAQLFSEIDETNSTNAKVDAMRRYFDEAPPEDAAWALFFLTGHRLRRVVKPSDMRRWAMEALGLEPWLYSECHSAVGDGSETIALLFDALPDAGETGAEPARPGGLFEEKGSAEPESDAPLHVWIGRVRELATLSPREQRPLVVGWWRERPTLEAMLLTKVLTGSFRVGVAHRLVVQALAAQTGRNPAEVAAHLTGEWEPTPDLLREIRDGSVLARSVSPYPFFLASPIQPTSTQEAGAEAVRALLGSREQWLAEWKWDGIRAQLIRRGERVSVWSRGDEELTERFPELVRAALSLPGGCVLDGEIVAWDSSNARPLPFASLQRRIGRLTDLNRAQAATPTAFLAFDLLEVEGGDIRMRSLRERRLLLEGVIGDAAERVRVSEEITASTWKELELLRGESRERGVEGLMLKRLESAYGTGRARGDWWKWKIHPHTVDCVLVYAEPGHGRRAGLLTDYTFAVWRGDELIPIARAYSGLSDEEIEELDRWLRGHTVERFGRVRRIRPVQVFELAFDAVQRSDRHSSGLALRFPRIVRWRRDMGPEAAERLEDVESLAPERRTGGQGELFDG